jgi:Trypsin-co-occurring domain 2
MTLSDWVAGGVSVAKDWVGLADAITALRRELNTALATGKDDALRFGLGPVDLEFLLEVKSEGGGEAGVRFGVVTVGVKGDVSRASTHRIKLVLQPQDRHGQPVDIADEE